MDKKIHARKIIRFYRYHKLRISNTVTRTKSYSLNTLRAYCIICIDDIFKRGILNKIQKYHMSPSTFRAIKNTLRYQGLDKKMYKMAIYAMSKSNIERAIM